MTFLVKAPCGYVDGRQDFVFASIYDDEDEALQKLHDGAEFVGMGGPHAAILLYRDDDRHYRGEMRFNGVTKAVADCDDFDALAKWFRARAYLTKVQR